MVSDLICPLCQDAVRIVKEVDSLEEIYNYSPPLGLTVEDSYSEGERWYWGCKNPHCDNFYLDDLATLVDLEDIL